LIERFARARRFDDALRPVGLTSGQFSLLISLNREAPPSISSVASLLAMDRTTLTANLKPLERRGLLTLAISPKDRRGRVLTLTADGLATLAAALPIWVETHAEVDARLAGAETAPFRIQLAALA
jgi:DNA-binding MarR family transcriptional regulator